MTIDEAIRILDPPTTLEALAEYEYYGGFSGPEARIEACNEACRVACAVLRRTFEYDKAREEGRLVVLPCKVGDTIYVIPSDTNRRLNEISHPENNRVYEQTVEAILWCRNDRYLLRTCTGLYEALSDEFGVTWFLTRQEAEAALEVRK